MLKEYFSSTIKKNILNEQERNGNYSIITGIDYRAPKENYEKFYTKEQLDFLFKNKLIQNYEKTGASWERPWMGEYLEFTNKGKRLRKWYNSSIRDYLYYNVFHLYEFKILWQKFMIKLGKHYTWQDYEGVDISEI